LPSLLVNCCACSSHSFSRRCAPIVKVVPHGRRQLGRGPGQGRSRAW